MNDVYVIAEAGVNHNGSEGLALELIDIAAQAGADAIKFQTFKAKKLVSPGAGKADYQKKATGDGDQYSMLKKLELSERMHMRLIEYCNKKNIEFLSTAFDRDSLDFLLSMGMKKIKIPSGEITNLPFIRYIALKDKGIILSTGMSDISDIEDAVDVIRKVRDSEGFGRDLEDILTILHCTSNYPADAKDVNLLAMSTIKSQFKLPIGYSDHTLGISVSTAAVALGARVIEKHFTISRQMDGPDHGASLEPEELKELVSSIRIVSEALGSDEKKPTDSELKVRALVRRSIVTTQSIKQGELITKDHIDLMRPGTGIQPKNIEKVIGSKAQRDIAIGELVSWEDIEVANDA